MDWIRATFYIGIFLIVTVNNCNAEGCEDELDFMCTSDKKCIKAELMCDHKYDCDDHSDEEDCGKISKTNFYAENVGGKWHFSNLKKFVSRLRMSDIRSIF